jgi:hypothetical protein
VAPLHVRQFFEHRGGIHLFLSVIWIPVTIYEAMFTAESTPIGNIDHCGGILAKFVFCRFHFCHPLILLPPND